IEESDAADLRKVYSDPKAVPFFNSDNCGGDDFHYTTESRMRQAIAYWLWEYRRRGFVRWTILDKQSGEAVGTVELFNRKADDYFTNCGLLRLDLRSDYETEEAIADLLSVIVPPAFDLFRCAMVATKAVPEARERIRALTKLHFVPTDEKVVGHDGTEYGHYYVST
ncbi:MAG: GNAT family N-acetyltransferase, partial [Eubacteriales bacterium]